MRGLDGLIASNIPTLGSPVKRGASSELGGLIADVISSPEVGGEDASNCLRNAAFNQLAQNELTIFSSEFSISVGLGNGSDLEGVDGHINFAIQSTVGVVNSNLIFTAAERTSYAFNLEVFGITSGGTQIGVKNLEECIVQIQDIFAISIVLISESNRAIGVVTRAARDNSNSVSSFSHSHGANHDDSQYQCEYFFHCDFLL